MRVDFIPKPLHWSPFNILILDCALKLNADLKKIINYFVYSTQIIIAVIVNQPFNLHLDFWKWRSWEIKRGVYLCLIFEMSIWEFITNSKKNRFRNKLDFLSSSNLIFTACVIRPVYIYLFGENKEWNNTDNLKIFGKVKVWKCDALNFRRILRIKK